MNLVQFSRPRARYGEYYDLAQGWSQMWCVSISWSFHGKQYKSIGEHSELEQALTHAWRPIIEQGWLPYVPADMLPDKLKPLQVLARLGNQRLHGETT